MGHRSRVTTVQYLLVQGVVSVLAISVLLPVGLVVLFLALRGRPVGGAIEHGELFLAGGNAAFVGAVGLFTARLEAGLNAAVAALLAIAFLVIPSYAAWAYLAVSALVGDSYSHAVAVASSAVAASVCVVTALILVRASYSADV